MVKGEKGVRDQIDIDFYAQLPYSVLLREIEDEGEKYWIAEIVELPGCKSHGSTVSEAVENVEEAKKDWILDGLERGEEIPLPIERDRFSGKTLVRMSRSLHSALTLIAESENLSLNQLIVTILAKEVGRLNILNRVEDKLDSLLVMMVGAQKDNLSYPEVGVVIKPFEYEDTLTGHKIAIRVSPFYYTMHIDDRVYYFTKDTLELDGTSRLMGGESRSANNLQKEAQYAGKTKEYI